MNAIFRRDHAAQQRRLALDDSIDHARRAVAALLAASTGEQDEARTAVLVDARRGMVAALRALTGLDP